MGKGTCYRNQWRCCFLVEILNVFDKESKKLSETKGKVIADYQNHLEKIWISDLKSKYSISINKDVLYSIIK